MKILSILLLNLAALAVVSCASTRPPWKQTHYIVEWMCEDGPEPERKPAKDHPWGEGELIPIERAQTFYNVKFTADKLPQIRAEQAAGKAGKITGPHPPSR
jgi:hypothetical protein